MLQRFWRLLISLRLALTLLLVLAIAAVVGTVLPQEKSYAFYLEKFGPQLAWLIDTLRLSQVYRSTWFVAIIALLLFNLLACSLERLPQALRRLTSPPDPEKYLKLPERAKLRWPARVEKAPGALEDDIAAVLGASHRHESGDTLWFWRRTGRAGVLGPYIIHLSIILIILGGLAGKLWGVKGQMIIGVGEIRKAVDLENRQELPLGFEVRLDDFQVHFYADGIPSEYRSDLTFLQDGKEAAQAVCRVNHPVEFGGYTFYQSTYQTIPRGPVRLRVDFEGQSQELEAPLRTPVPLPGGQRMIVAVRVDGNLQGLGPAVQLIYLTGRGHSPPFWVLQNHPEAARQPGPHVFTLTGADFRYASGLMVKQDPGVWWVYAGFILLIPGFWLAFFTPRQWWAVRLQPDGKKGWLLTIHGTGDRHREAFARRLERLRAKLAERT